MKDAPINLPPLPETKSSVLLGTDMFDTFLPSQMFAYARAAVLADRARREHAKREWVPVADWPEVAPGVYAAPSPAEPPVAPVQGEQCVCNEIGLAGASECPAHPDTHPDANLRIVGSLATHVAIEVKLNEKIESLKAENERLQKELRQTQEYGHEQWGRALAAESQAAAMAGLLEEAQEIIARNCCAIAGSPGDRLERRIDAALATWKGKQ